MQFHKMYINVLRKNQFARYYQVPSNDLRSGKAPVIELGFERNFHVEKIFLDEIEGLVRTNSKEKRSSSINSQIIFVGMHGANEYARNIRANVSLCLEIDCLI